MRIPAVRRWAQAQHRTGLQSDPALSQALLSTFRDLLPADLSASRVLELGPGRGTGLMLAAQPHVASYAAFDVEPYLDRGQLQDAGIDYRVEADGHLPWAARTFDVVWSHSVLEHVRAPADLLGDAHRVLRPGGWLIASIDLQDHYGDRRDPGSMYGFLRYSARLWWWMTSNRSAFCNRLRASDWRALALSSGFEIVQERITPPAATLTQLRAVPYLTALGDDDLMAAEQILLLKAAT